MFDDKCANEFSEEFLDAMYALWNDTRITNKWVEFDDFMVAVLN